MCTLQEHKKYETSEFHFTIVYCFFVEKIPPLTTPLVRSERTMTRYPGDPSRKVTHSTHDPVTHCPICSGGYIAHILKNAIL